MHVIKKMVGKLWYVFFSHWKEWIKKPLQLTWLNIHHQYIIEWEKHHIKYILQDYIFVNQWKMPQQHISSYENGEKYERTHTRSLIYVKYESTGCGRYEMGAEKGQEGSKKRGTQHVITMKHTHTTKNNHWADYILLIK